jgi:uncharacterized protein YciI
VSALEHGGAFTQRVCENEAGVSSTSTRRRRSSVHFLLFYEFVPEYLERRAPQRAEHLRLAWEAHDRGELLLGGALAGPADGAVLLFQGPDDRAARAFAEADPYVTTGLVRRWWVRSWTTVVGDAAATPVRSAG